MSFGKMNTQIQITQKRVTLDDEGFQTESDAIVAEVREPIGRVGTAARNGQTEPPFPKLPTCSDFAPFRE